MSTLNFLSPHFPALLREIAQPPRCLYYEGDASLFSRPALAIVGTRHPSTYGIRAALHFGRALAERGFVIVSGLARGIDTAAHRGALDCGGETVAVLGHGLDRVYPVENTGLARRIFQEGGCLLSEYALGVGPRKHHFPERNRVIAGLALGTLVIEATPKSGSLITARQALDQNREVFAVPGGFDDGGFAGSHTLLKQGAKLVTSPEDLLEELPAEFVLAASRFAKPVAFARDAQVEKLRPHFSDESPRTLGELAAVFDGAPAELLRTIESARSQGALAEISPQQYLWLKR